ncbi:MAG TPA: hypothetical protein VGJ84_19070, partial [Polyangiaceae bacterium]
MLSQLALLLGSPMVEAACTGAVLGSPNAPPTSRPVVISDRLPLIASGDRISADGTRPAKLSQSFRLPTPGVWYIFLKVSVHGDQPALLTYSVDDVPPIRSQRGKLRIARGTHSKWVRTSLHQNANFDEEQPGSDKRSFHAEIHIDEAGDHVVHITALEGDVTIEKLALTLFHTAQPRGDTLDHAHDPGEGRATFSQPSERVDGFRKHWKSPEIVAKRRFYVDSDHGNDGSDGLDPTRPWRSLNPVNQRQFEPGDAILLKRGGRWQGGMRPRGNGSVNAWITIGAYGEGTRPYIDGGENHAVSLTDQSYWVIQDLELTSDPTRRRCGLSVSSEHADQKAKDIKVFNLIAYDNGPSGINIGGGKGDGCDGVWVENCLCY